MIKLFLAFVETVVEHLKFLALMITTFIQALTFITFVIVTNVIIGCYIWLNVNYLAVSTE